MSALALFIFSFSAHLLTKGNIHSISKVMRQMHERSEQAYLKILRLGMVTNIIVAYQISFSPSFSLAEPWFISEQQDVQLKKKKKINILWSPIQLEMAT